MTNIYLVTSGTYSDYRISAAFSTRELAQEYIDKLGAIDFWKYETPEIEEWPLDREMDAENRELFGYEICVETGNMKERIGHGGTVYGVVSPKDFCPPVFKWDRLTKDNKPETILVAQSYVSQEHAHKRAVEARQKYLATGALLGNGEEVG